MRSFALLVLLALAGCAGRQQPSETSPAAAEPPSARQVDAQSMRAELERKQYEEDQARSRSDFIGRNQVP